MMINEQPIMIGFVRQKLNALMAQIPSGLADPVNLPPTEITGIQLDSRLVEPGNIFVALQGQLVDGHRYIPDAIQRGASAIIGSRPVGVLGVPYIRTVAARLVLSHLAAAFFRFPADNMTVIGVTGTDGKTTTANMIFQILQSAGYRVGIISTVNAVIGQEVVDTGFHVTTPEAIEVQRFLARMVAAGITHVVLECTSHGLEQERVSGRDIDIGVVTNITHEHLDYHRTYEAYLAAKARLFTGMAEGRKKIHTIRRLAVLNRDDGAFDYLKEITTVDRLEYSQSPGPGLWAKNIRMDANGLVFTVNGEGIFEEIESSLLGGYNVSNILAALGATVVGLGIPLEAAREGIRSVKGVPGRMERIDLGQDFLAVVDFAHTPNSLKWALQTARQLTTGKLIVVFGSAGLRDRQKRKIMAEVAAERSDCMIITAEDPRTESLDDILAEMAGAAVSQGAREGGNLWRISDRGEAIRQAVALAETGDLVITCGKGHEQSMCFGTVEYPWDDRIAMRAAIAESLGISGPAMPDLPTGK